MTTDRRLRCYYCQRLVTPANCRGFHVAWGSYRGDMYEARIVCLPGREACFRAHVDMIETLEPGGYVADWPMPLSKPGAQRIVKHYWPSSRQSYAFLMNVVNVCAGWPASEVANDNR